MREGCLDYNCSSYSYEVAQCNHMSLPEYPLDGLPLPRPEPLVAELGEGLVQHGVAVRLAR